MFIFLGLEFLAGSGKYKKRRRAFVFMRYKFKFAQNFILFSFRTNKLLSNSDPVEIDLYFYLRYSVPFACLFQSLRLKPKRLDNHFTVIALYTNRLFIPSSELLLFSAAVVKTNCKKMNDQIRKKQPLNPKNSHFAFITWFHTSSLHRFNK